MNEELGVVELAEKRFKEGYNCAEAVLRAFRDGLNLNLNDDALRLATAFGGGLGQAGCMCGALSGSIMVLSLLQGRDNSTESRNPAYSSAKDFHASFTKHFGTSCCRVLNRHEFGTSDQRRACLKITTEAADLLMKYITENDLLRGRKDGGK